MCLQSVEELFSKNNNCEIGYKVFKVRPWGLLFNEIYATSCPRRVGKTYRVWDKGYIRSDNGVLYPKGFHIFTEFEDAARWMDEPDTSVFKVRACDVRAIGGQSAGSYTRCVVAKRMTILEEVRAYAD